MRKKTILPIFILTNFVLTIFLSAMSVVAQTAPPAENPPSPPQSGGPATRTRQEPCWQEAGIPAQVFRQHEGIERDKHAQVQSVCANTSLNVEQKVEQVAQIRQAAQQKEDDLISAEQQKSLAACRLQRLGPTHERANPCVGQGRRRGAPAGGQSNPEGTTGGNSPQPQQPQN